MSGFELSSLHPRLGQETLTRRTVQRRGRNCVLKKFPDNTGLCSMSFIFLLLSFLVFKGWHWKFQFYLFFWSSFSTLSFKTYSLCFWPRAQCTGFYWTRMHQQPDVCRCEAACVRWGASVCLRDCASLICQKEIWCFSQKIPISSRNFNQGSKICMQWL